MKFKINTLNILYKIEDFWSRIDNIEENREKTNNPEQDKKFINHMNLLDDKSDKDNKNMSIKDTYNKIKDFFKKDPDAQESWIALKAEKEYKKTINELENWKTKWFDKTPENFQKFIWILEKKG